jgi:hypothetical protein
MVVLCASFVACGDEPASDPDTGEDTVGDSGDVVSTDTVADVMDEVDTGPSGPPTLSERGHVEVRLIAHLHSAYSHDGCDDKGLDEDGNPNLECIARMKRALCSERIGFAYMTDHPSNMRDQPWLDLLYADPPNDDVVLMEDGQPWGVRFACDEGEGGPDQRVTLLVGYEGTHTMPLGLRRHVDWSKHHTFEDAAPFETLAATTQAVREAGGHVAIAHSEQDDLSAETIAAHDVSAMELYNFHANFNEVLGGGIGDALFLLEHFVDPEAELPDPDLTALILFGSYPEAALNKWREVSWLRPITAFAGADVHENVSFPAACEGNVCDGLAEMYPNLVEYLKVGGPVWQSDGERLDGYARVFRWSNNRVFVPAAVAADPLAVEAAFFGGRAAVVFEVLGESTDYALVLEDPSAGAEGGLVDLGQTVTLKAGQVLWARSPSSPKPPPFADWTDGAAAELTTILWRTDATGTHEVARWSEAGRWRSFPVTEVGAYQLEVLVAPRHLAGALGPAAELAEGTYRWIETNAIRVEAP